MFIRLGLQSHYYEMQSMKYKRKKKTMPKGKDELIILVLDLHNFKNNNLFWHSKNTEYIFCNYFTRCALFRRYLTEILVFQLKNGMAD